MLTSRVSDVQCRPGGERVLRLQAKCSRKCSGERWLSAPSQILALVTRRPPVARAKSSMRRTRSRTSAVSCMVSPGLRQGEDLRKFESISLQRKVIQTICSHRWSRRGAVKKESDNALSGKILTFGSSSRSLPPFAASQMWRGILAKIRPEAKPERLLPLKHYEPPRAGRKRRR
jgi:hypothetical protein